MSNVDRRTFLASAGAGAAAVALGNGAGAAGPNDRLRVAVVGICGKGQSHIDAFSENKATSVAALCDVAARVLDRSAQAFESKTGKAPEKVADLRRLMDDKSIDIISIATHNHWHA